MTKKQVIQKIKDILSKDEIFNANTVEVKFTKKEKKCKQLK